MRFTTLTYIFTTAFAGAGAHMEMSTPPPLRSKFNPHAGNNVDYGMTNPLSGAGGDFPCKGSLGLLGTDQGQSVATWSAGGTYSATISGGATHNGGSCQISFSSDHGATFRVLHSYVGNCPAEDGATYTFNLPNDTPSTDQGLLAWSWFNNLGNREMYMNCAVISVTGGGDGLGNRPLMFKANIGNGCKTTEGSNVDFPNPGPDVTVTSGGTPPVGNCDNGPGASDPAVLNPSENHPKDPGLGRGSGRDWSSDINGADSCSGSGPRPGSIIGNNRNAGEWSPGNDWPGWFSSGSRVDVGWVHISTAIALGITLVFE